MNEKIKAIITGASGMVGEGVLYECLNHPEVESVLVIGRKPCGHAHPKLKEIIHNNFFNLTEIENQLSGYNACYFCLGVSSVGISEEEYYKLTYTLTLHFANTLIKYSPQLTFCYVSGSGTDSSEKGRLAWARIKGKTENDLMKLSFKNVYAFRPGFMQPTKGLKNALSAYKYIGWLFPVLRLFTSIVSTLAEVGQAMINITFRGYDKKVIEVKDILVLAKR